MAFVKAIMDWDFSGAERTFKKSLELEPGNVDVQLNYNVFLRVMGRFEEGIQRQERLEKSAPPGDVNLLASFFLWANRLAEGLEIAEEAFHKSPILGNKLWLAIAYRLNGRLDEAQTMNQELLDQQFPVEKDLLLEIAIINALSGKRGEAQKIMDRVVSLCAEKGIDHTFHMACFHGALGEKDKAIEFLHQAFKNRLGVLINLKTYPDFRCLHGDPRFEELVKKMGFPAIPRAVQNKK
jgi:serine/threonine-protein kinase